MFFFIVFFSFGSAYKTKQTLPKAVKKVLCVLPNNVNQQQQILQRVSEDLGIALKTKPIRVQSKMTSWVVKTVQEFYKLHTISW